MRVPEGFALPTVFGRKAPLGQSSGANGGQLSVHASALMKRRAAKLQKMQKKQAQKSQKASETSVALSPKP